MPDFLLEIGTEEIPARMIDSAREELRAAGGRPCCNGSVWPTAQPWSRIRRRDAWRCLPTAFRAAQPDVQEQLTGPSTKVAFKDGEPTPAAHAFAKKAGWMLSRSRKITTPKGEYIAATVAKKGRPRVGDSCANCCPKKLQRHLLGEEHVLARKDRGALCASGALAGGDARWRSRTAGVRRASAPGRASRGHRILSSGELYDPSAGRVLCRALASGCGRGRSRAEREQQIRKALDAATRTIPGARWREDKALLDTVVNLTESPSVDSGQLRSANFLRLPEEVLVTVMRDHQKYFAVEDANGKLLPHFLAVLNTIGDPDGLIRHGNERVLRARFNDARFFWQTDQKIDLRQRVEWLKAVTFQKDLGSYYDKTVGCRNWPA